MVMIHLFSSEYDQFPEKKSPQESILFFDGVCGLCNRFVTWFLTIDVQNAVKLSPLQGEKAKELLEPRMRQLLNTVVLFDHGQIYTQSEAVLRAVEHLGGIWKVCKLLRWIPRFVRDSLYRYIAKNRYHWFGKQACRLPSPSEKAHFYP